MIKSALLFVLFCSVSLAQTIPATTRDGRAVLLKPDGTWEFAPKPAADTPSTVYVYRLKEPGLYNRGTPIRLDGKEILEIKQGDFVGLRLSPGDYKFRTNKDDSEITVTAKPGGRLYVYLVVGYGGFSQTHILNEVTEAAAILQLKKTNYIDEKQLKVANLSLVKEKPTEQN